jgi:hypothetical protein
MNKSEIIFKAVNENFHVDNASPFSTSTYLCNAIIRTKKNYIIVNPILKAIAEDILIHNPNCTGIFMDKKGGRDQMQVATYGLFLSEYFKDIK